MKKNNNRFRSGTNNNNNNNSNQYSLTYKFDSNSIAGKMSGTALDLIKKYNELAKEALSNHDYVAAETFKQFAEHYRKIVTDINERKNVKQNKKEDAKQPKEDSIETSKETQEIVEQKESTIKEVVVEEEKTQETSAPKKKTLRKKLVVVNAVAQ